MDRVSQPRKQNDFGVVGFSLFDVSASLGGVAIAPNHKSKSMEDFFNVNEHNEINAQIIRTGITMQDVVDLLADECG